MACLNAAFLTESELAGLGFASIGRNARIHSTCVLVDCARIQIGDNVRIDPYCVLSAVGGIGIGNHVHVASYCALAGEAPITLDDFCGISNGTKVYSSTDDFDGLALTGPTVPNSFRRVRSGPVRVGRHVIVGAGTVILPDVEIGDGCAVGALSLVSRSLAGWEVYAGTPVRRLRARERRVLALEERLSAGAGPEGAGG